MFRSSASHRSKSLWKRKATNSTLNLKRKCIINSEQNDKSNNNNNNNNNERDRKKPIQNTNSGKKLRLNNELSSTQSDETTYCLCSQV